MVFILSSSTAQILTAKQRAQLEVRLGSYNIPSQILQLVADRCGSKLEPGKQKLPAILASLNDKAIVLLEQIFLECHDSFSGYRFAVFLSSIYGPILYKFVMDDKATIGPGIKCSFDIGIYRRDSGNLVAIGVQNMTQQAADSASLRKFLATVKSLNALGIRGAYYSSSYGYTDSSQWRAARKAAKQDEMEVRFFDYRDQIYVEFESK